MSSSTCTTLKWISTVAVAFGLMAPSACGSNGRAVRSLQSQPSPYGPSRYTSEETLDYGKLIMDPDPTNGPTRMTQGQAFAAAGKNPVFGPATDGYTPEVRYGLFTNNASGTPDASGKLIPATYRAPAWMVL